MLTLNVIGTEDKVITGSVNGEKFSINYNENVYKDLLMKKAFLESIQTMDEYDTWVEEVKAILDTDTQDIITTACPDLMKDAGTGKYHVQHGGKTSKKAVPQPIVDVILESVEKDIDPAPIVKCWIRFLRNPNFKPNKAELFARYLTATIVDWDEKNRLMEEEGYISARAELRATYNDVAITQEGLIVGKKYARLLTKGWEINQETNKPVKIKLPYIASPTVDPHTGDVVEGDIAEGTFNEDLIFEPPVMGTSGDEFFCGQQKGHAVRVGQKHTLPDWSFVNTNDQISCVKGLHVGGWQYVSYYKSLNCQLLECFIDPAEIGAVCDVGHGDGAMRVREYFIFGATEGRNKGIYHSSHYASMKDTEWEDYKVDAIEKSNKLMGNLTDDQDELGW